MVDKNIELAVFAAYRLGVEVRFQPAPDEAHHCPFSVYLAIQFPRTLYIEPDVFELKGLPAMELAGHVIHELGHLCVTQDVESAEFPFFGWEFAVAKFFDLEDAWRLSSRDYGVGRDYDYCEFGSLLPVEQETVLAERFMYAIRAGFLTPTGRPHLSN